MPRHPDHREPALSLSAFLRTGRLAFAFVLACGLTACGGGGGGGGGGSSNTAPIASFTANPTSGTAPVTVSVNASASSDPDGSITSYAWTFGDGGTATGVSATHSYNAGGTFTVTLTVTDNRGANAQTAQTVTVSSGPPPASVTVSGRVTYERVPFSSNVQLGLDYANTTAEPARGVVVELVSSASQAALLSTTTDDDGRYSFAAPPSTSVFVRAKALSQRSGSPGWDIRVVNNTNSNALYALVGATFNTGIVDQTDQNLLADSGWTGQGYGGLRAAAPFAILDSLYTAVQFILANGNPTQVLMPLQVFWSPQNRSVDGDPATGDIGSTLYWWTDQDSFEPGIYVLGDAGNDTDEYDQHVLVHEFQHFLEDAISRTDTPGGSHSLSERLDMRLAFSEGFANAFSAIVLGDPRYSDSLGPAQSQRFSFSVEDNSTAGSTPGWFNEGSVQSLVWDLYDAAPDGSDSVSLGYGPMFDVFVSDLKTGQPQTSLYPFVSGLVSRAPASTTAITTLVNSQQVFSTNAFGAGETNGGGLGQALPVYTPLTLNGGPQRVCGSREAGSFNRLGNRRFLTFSLASSRSVSIQAQYTSTGSTAPFAPDADPDIVLFKGAELTRSESDVLNNETLVVPLQAGDYVIEVYEYSHVDPAITSLSSRRGITCMNVSVSG